ncbi:MAG: hypothetical protein A2Y73_04955 [Chloroflexi bacterium RBG_13_56_8]|nr:MAG: hypothetical protein A2Y73_04955 [Chloroflexi bacterium RBG_13_56_8]
MTASDDANAEPIEVRRVWKVHDGQGREREAESALEEPLALHINENRVAILMRLPGMEKELAAGFCVSEGLVKDFDDIFTIHHCGQGLPAPGEEETDSSPESRNLVEIRTRPKALEVDPQMEVVRLIRVGCGAANADTAELPLPQISDGPIVAPEVLLGLDKIMRAGQLLHQRVGGVHGAALFNIAGETVVICEDLGRHNAVDKAVGYCLMRDIPLQDKILLCSGRLSYEMVTKAIRLRIPLLASMSAPTALALQLGERFNLTMVGYLRGRRMTIYTHPERISFEA